MIGYGLLNSQIQYFAITGIIQSFLERSIIFLYPAYIYLSDKNETTNKMSTYDDLFNIFIQEEIYIGTQTNKNNILKYVLSANVAKDKDYDFNNKDNEKILEEGKTRLKELFNTTLESFFKDKKITNINDKYFYFFNGVIIKNVLKEKIDQNPLYYKDSHILYNIKKLMTSDKYNGYLKARKLIYDFYQKNNFLKKREIYLNILNEQINSLNQGESI